ncbi:hypothetical protein M3080_03475 [Parasutterella secunda]|uniref:lipopolysaccharide biosynthesis protein n=1 Tax=Parasutterella secunda TaxID=626947 RepID=UPI00201205FC|nr:hypothetical protein [Parasutterella secunda]MCL1596428.1 hypothetical protein [Parasutterella secunda]
MAVVSRTARVIQNAKIALIFYCINLILQFFSRKIFLDYLGAELLGLNTTAQNLLQFLNLAESGIGAAVAFALYKPLSQNNRQEIIDIVSLQGWFYRWVGLFVIAGSIVLMAFFPWIFDKTEVPLIYAYGTFIAFLFSAILGYFVNYKMIVLSADQKEYKITIETQRVKVIKVFIQMWAIWQLPDGYLWWMVLEVFASILTSINLNRCIKNEYPWLTSRINEGRSLNCQYPFILNKTKQLFFHKLGGFVLNQTTPLVIYFFYSLTVVAIYGNYLFVMSACLLFVDALARGFYAGVGNLVSKSDCSTIKKVFWELYTFKLCVAGVITHGIWYLSDSFITLWIGKEYVMPPVPLLLLTMTCFIQMSRTCDVFLGAMGLYRDVWAPIIESALNLTLSILLGYYWGLSGVFLGVLLSQIVVVVGWKGYFLYMSGFKKSAREYFESYLKKIVLLTIASILTTFFVDKVILFNITSFIDWVVVAFLTVVTNWILTGVLFLLFDDSFKLLILRVKQILRKR